MKEKPLIPLRICNRSSFSNASRRGGSSTQLTERMAQDTRSEDFLAERDDDKRIHVKCKPCSVLPPGQI